MVTDKTNMRINVAIVDDEVEVFELFKMHFRRELRSDKYTLYFFENGGSCYKFIEKKSKEVEILIILSDVNMPIMDGVTLLGLVKRNFPKIKVFMITAYETEELKGKVNSMGASGFLSKPLDFEELKTQLIDIESELFSDSFSD